MLTFPEDAKLKDARHNLRMQGCPWEGCSSLLRGLTVVVVMVIMAVMVTVVVVVMGMMMTVVVVVVAVTMPTMIARPWNAGDCS